MKRRIFTLLLALVMVLSMLPVQARAADDRIAIHGGLSSDDAVAGLTSRAPEAPVTNAHDMNNEVNIYYTEGGTVTATRRDEDDWDTYAVITAIPDEGYVLYGLAVENANGETSNIRYKGNHVFEVELIYDTTTDIYIYFSKPQGEKHDIRVEVSDSEGGTYTLTKTQAYAGEQVFVDLDLNLEDHYTRAYVNFTGGLYHPVRDHKHSEELYEFLMPDCDVIVSIRYLQDQPISLSCYSYGGGTITLDRTTGYPGDTFRCTILPNDGYRINYIYAQDYNGLISLKYVGSNMWEGVIAEDAGHVGIDVTFAESEHPFLDVPEDSFYYESVLWALENGVTTGADASHFNPTGECLRAQVVTFLWRAEGCPEPTTTVNPFVDVKETDFYYKAVLWAVENGITNGADADHFNPFGVCNRAQVVTFLHRAKGSPAPESMELPFTDVPADQWFAAPVAWAVENGITNGISAAEFGPNAACNRAQVVTFLYRAKDIPKAEPQPDPDPDTVYYFDLTSNDTDMELGFIYAEGVEYKAGDTVRFYAEPWFGYLVEFTSDPEVEGLELRYLGAYLYELTMPAHDLTIHAEFVPAEGSYHTITTTCTGGEFFTNSDVDDDLNDIAKPGEHVLVYIYPEEGFVLTEENVRAAAGGEAVENFWFLGEFVEEYPELDFVDRYYLCELVMPDADVTITISCTAGTSANAAQPRVNMNFK